MPCTVAHQAPLCMKIYRQEYLEWVAIPFSRESSQPRDQTRVSCTAGRFFTKWATREVLEEKKKKSKRIPEKNIYLCFIDYTKAFGVITTNCGKFFKRWEYQTTWPVSWEICMQVKKQQLEPNMGQQTGSKSRKEYVTAVYCHPAYLTYVQSTSWKTLGWMTHKLESRFLGEISITSYMQVTPPFWQKAKRN